MSSVRQLLHEQLESHARAWQRHEADIITPRELAPQLRISLALYHAISDFHDDLGAVAQPGQAAFVYAKAIEVEELYRLWDVVARSIWNRVKRGRDEGHAIDVADEFKEVYFEVGSIISVPIDHILEAQKQLREGRKIPH